MDYDVLYYVLFLLAYADYVLPVIVLLGALLWVMGYTIFALWLFFKHSIALIFDKSPDLSPKTAVFRDLTISERPKLRRGF